MIFEMVAGRPPFLATSLGKIIQAHLTEPPPHLRDFRPEVSESLQAVVEKALAKKPADRFQTADDILQALQLIAAASTLERADPERTRTTPMPTYAPPAAEATEPADSGRRFWIVGAIVAILAAAGWFLLKPGPAAVPQGAAVAILRPEVMANDPRVIPLGSGIAQEIGVALRQVEGIRITSDASVAALQARGFTLRQMADSLGVQLLVSGSVQSDQTRAHITLQLVDAARDDVVWSESWDFPMDSLLAGQRIVAARVVEAVRGRLNRP
jgi:serine/threonine-protein kinase